MRLTRVDLFSNDVEAISFSLNDMDPRAKYQIRSIFGLDADEIIHKFYGFSAQTAMRGYDFGLKAREIAIRAVLNPNFRNTESFSDIRDTLYRAIFADRTGKLTLHFCSGATTVAKIEGFITKFEVPYFTQLPEVQITINCDDPMFRGINPVRYEDADLPTSNPLILPDSSSTAPHGFTMQATFTATTTDISINDAAGSPEWVFTVIPATSFVAGDILYFSSEFSNKYLWVNHGGTRIDLIDRLQSNSVWPIIFPGANTFILPEIANYDLDEIEYYPAYWGV